MKRFRARLADLSSTVAALFALSIAAPHAGLYYHEHPGGERAHLHAEDESGLAELLADYWHGHDHVHTHLGPSHDRRPGADLTYASRTELARDDGPATGHWHQQDRFHRAVVAAAPFVVAVAPIGAALPRAATRSTPLTAFDLRARGPPRAPLS